MSGEQSVVPGAIRKVAARLDALSIKERVLVVAAVLMTLCLGWDALVLKPLDLRKRALLDELTTTGESLAGIESVSNDLIKSARVDPDASTRALLGVREQELREVELLVETKVGRVVQPQQMAEVLQSVLGRFHELEFLGLEGLGVEPLVDVTDDGEAKPAKPDVSAEKPATGEERKTAYRHGIRIRFAGSYLAALAYMKALESLPWGFFWDSVELETKKFPRVEGSIVVYTVSLEKGWIGV